MDRKSILKNINNSDDKLIVSKALDQLELCLKYHQHTFTDFIPVTNVAMVLEAIKGVRDVNYIQFGGNQECERRKLGFAPDYMEISEEDFPLAIVKFTFNKKFATEINHRDYLGSILGLGIDRGKVGDIIIMDFGAVCFVDEEIAHYIAANLERVGKNPIKSEVLNINDFQFPQKKLDLKQTTIASLRLDAVIGAGFNISRGKAQTLIEGQKAFVNWSLVSNTSYIVKEQDMISLRGFGRIVIEQINGKTKKDRISIVIGKYV